MTEAADVRTDGTGPGTLLRALVGALAVIPVILLYTGWAYYVFRGKVGADGGYH